MIMSETQLLKEALENYISRWQTLLNNTCEEKQKIKLNSFCYLAGWIINSINGGLSKEHATNICNVILQDWDSRGRR